MNIEKESYVPLCLELAYIYIEKLKGFLKIKIFTLSIFKLEIVNAFIKYIYSA